MEQNFSITPTGVCARRIDFTIDNGTLHNVKFYGGCPGNTLATSKLLEGYDAKKAIEILKGNLCGGKGTSCADQLARGMEEALSRVS